MSDERDVVIVTEERDIARHLLAAIPGSRRLEPPDDSLLDADVAVLFSSATSRAWGPRLRERGVLTIDHATPARMDPAVPTIVPQVNAADLARHDGVVASPNCASVMLALALAPIHRALGIRRAVVVTMQAISGAGDEVADPWNAAPVLDLEARIPRGRRSRADGETHEEHETREELRRLLGAPGLAVSATCVRVPVRNAHGIAVHLELERPPGAVADIEALLRRAPLVSVDDALPTPLGVAGSDLVHVGRVREDSAMGGLALWVVGDNLRRGTALNAADILLALDAAG